MVFRERPEERFQNAWREVCGALGEPLVFDAARVSAAHRLRAYWTSFGDVRPPKPCTGRDVRDCLESGRPRVAPYTDKTPMFQANVRGEEMRKFPT